MPLILLLNGRFFMRNITSENVGLNRMTNILPTVQDYILFEMVQQVCRKSVHSQ